MKVSDLRKYAKLIVRIGANVQKGQDVVINASVDDAYFVKYVVEEAYKAKARLVTVEWMCDEVDVLTYKHAKAKDLCEFPTWKEEKLKYRVEKLPALIYIESSDPDAMSKVDQNKMMEVRKVTGPIVRKYRDQMENKYQWTIVSIPGKAWAKKLFPELSPNKAVSKLWDAIFECARVNGDPIKNWDDHNANLLEKCNKLNALNIKKLVYKSANGTDFNVSLIPGTQFVGGGEDTIGGVYYNPNMPTEECFISPNKDSANGVVMSTKPLSVMGTVVSDFGFRFENGNIVEVISKKENEKAILEKLISLDEGAKRLGEVALVPFNSPVNQTGILFFNTLFDENACCHLAVGRGFEDTIKGFTTMTEEELEKFDINQSMIHVDFMIGSADLSIVAETDNGNVQIFKDGNWAI